MPAAELTIEARYVFPVDGPPIESGCVRVAGNHITYVGRPDREPDQRLGNVAILPGLVNAHTHLELSNLRAKDFASCDFAGWLRRVVELRRQVTRASLTHAVQRGIDSSISAGTTLVADISTGGQSWIPLLHSPLRATVFCELLGLRSSRAIELANNARQFLEWCGAKSPAGLRGTETAGAVVEWTHRLCFDDGGELPSLPPVPFQGHAPRLVPSLSPHAPYSAHPLLYELASRWDGPGPLTTHLAETPEELRLLEHGDGPLRSFLLDIGAWDESWKPLGRSPVDYVLNPPADRRHWLIAHGNCLDEEQIARLASTIAKAPDGTLDGAPAARRVAVAYCPRTHFFFGRPRHPYSQLLAAGIPVCLGTDSLASNPNLSVLDELRFLHRRDDSLSGATLLHMATLAGATALGRHDELGSLAPGKIADLAIVRLPDREESDPHRLVIESDLPVVRTIIAGRTVFQMRG